MREVEELFVDCGGFVPSEMESYSTRFCVYISDMVVVACTYYE